MSLLSEYMDVSEEKDFEGSEGTVRDEELERKAKENNCRIVEPAHNELQLDIDNAEDCKIANFMLERYGDRIGAVEIKETPSPSGNPDRCHITVTLKPDKYLHHVERMLLQACLGSDVQREILSYIRYCEGDTRPTIFFEKIEEGNKETETEPEPLF